MPPKAKAKADSASPASKSPTRSRSRPKKGPKHELGKKIIALRDELIAKADGDAEKIESIHKACTGMYKCDKEVDLDCLNRILSELQKVQGGGKKRRSTSSKRKSRSRSRSRSRPRAH